MEVLIVYYQWLEKCLIIVQITEPSLFKRKNRVHGNLSADLSTDSVDSFTLVSNKI